MSCAKTWNNWQIYVQGNGLKIVQMDYKDTIKEMNGKNIIDNEILNISYRDTKIYPFFVHG